MERTALLAATLFFGCSEDFAPTDKIGLDDTAAGETGTTEETDTRVDEPASITFTSPGDEASGAVTLSVAVTGPVARVGYFLDALPLVESTDASTGYSAAWTPEDLGYTTLNARAYDAEGVEIASDSTRTRVIDVDPDNYLGVWLEDNEIAGYTHAEIAQRLASLGVKRVYIQTAGAGSGCETYPAACDDTVPEAYHSRGIQAFAFAVPPPGPNNSLMTNVTYVSDSDYDGYVILLADSWAGQNSSLATMAEGFRATVDENIAIGRAPSNFGLFIAAGPTPSALDIRLEIADPFVDGFMPLLLVEQLGADAVADPGGTLSTAVCEYASLGLTRPVYPILGTETGEVTPLGVNNFFQVGGEQSSIWRIPDAGDVNDIWDTWGKVDWTDTTLPAGAACE